ncbi:MAG TPA: hypothetical protein VF637_17560 [Sphingomicrobium sp.]|jgi:hypothetical protein
MPTEIMIIVIVAIVATASVIKGGLRHVRPLDLPTPLGGGNGQENARLRDEVRELKERIHVLERITTDKENSLAKQIEELRDR